MRLLLLAVLLVAMTGCGPDTKSEDQPTTPTKEDQPTAPEETVSLAETPNGSDESSAKAGVPAVNSVGMRFVPIPAGEFTMGSGSTTTYQEHPVKITKPFHLGAFEVTQEQYQEVMGKNPSYFKGPTNPVDKASWEGAVEFCRKLSELPKEKEAGHVYRLPTEAEWEYACRAGTTTAYSFGDDESQMGQYAWYRDNSGKTAHPVGKKKPNPWGLYDMHGNVWEWCQDWLGAYPSEPVTDPTGPTTPTLGSYRVFRGGSWYDYATEHCRSRSRNWGGIGDWTSISYMGFRVALDSSASKPSGAESGSR